MDVKNRGIALTTVFTFLLLSTVFTLSFSHSNQFLKQKDNTNPSKPVASTVVFRLNGNVYPLGHYTVNFKIGNPPRIYDLDIDTGSDITWVQCDAPCKGCTKPKNQLYKPKGNLVPCGDPLCDGVLPPQEHHCDNPKEQCDYEVEYADHGSSFGVLVRDIISLPSTRRTFLNPLLAFGCGYDQHHSGPTSPPSTAGVLGLGNGKASILSQLSSQGLIRNVVGHCLSVRGGGFMFFGDQLIPSSGVVWTPMLHSSSENHYISGPADLFFNGKPTSVKGLELIFDSGSSYTYFNSQTYKAVVDLVTNDLKGKQLTRAVEDKSLPVCWKGAKPFKSLNDVKNYFKPLVLSFTKSKNSQLQLPPEAYLIVTQHGSVCLGILDGSEAKLGSSNVIGDISLQAKLVIYDNENQRIGWISTSCERPQQS